MEKGPELLKLTKLQENNNNIKAFLTILKRAMEAYGMERDMWAAILASQLMNASHYDRVKAAISHYYNINEESYH